MAKVKTSNTLISDIKRRAMIPQSDQTFTTQDFLDILNEELMIGVMPKIIELHEEYYVTTEPMVLVTDSSPARYKIPYRATGDKLRDVMANRGDGLYIELSRVNPENKDMYYGSDSYAFYVENDEIVMLNGNIQGTVECSYYFRPSELVIENRAGLITNIDTDTGIVTVSSFPTNFTTAIEYDFIKAKSPNKIMGYDKDAVAISSTLKTIEFAPADLPTELVVGDYLMQAEETIVPQLPNELTPILTQMAAIACLESIGDLESLDRAERKLMKMEKGLGVLIDNRVVGAQQKIVNKNSRLGRRVRRNGYNI